MSCDIASALDEIAREIRICTRCPLHQSRLRAVPGEGDAIAPILFIGEAPGVDEDRLGRPFVGAAGRLLTELLDHVGIARGDVRIENTVRCRPPRITHRPTPPPAESIAMCRPYLDRTLRLLRPRIVVPLGRIALSIVLPHRQTITGSHGTAYWHEDRWVFPMIHPAWALRHPNTELARTLMMRDIVRLRHLLYVDTRTRRRPWDLHTLALLMEALPFTAPAVRRDESGTLTVTWDTTHLHPMFRTPSAIDELLRRATGLPIHRWDHGGTTGVIRAAALDPDPDEARHQGSAPGARSTA